MFTHFPISTHPPTPRAPHAGAQYSYQPQMQAMGGGMYPLHHQVHPGMHMHQAVGDESGGSDPRWGLHSFRRSPPFWGREPPGSPLCPIECLSVMFQPTLHPSKPRVARTLPKILNPLSTIVCIACDAFRTCPPLSSCFVLTKLRV